MKLQRDIGKFPTEKPPDPESEGPGAVGTAAEAKFEDVLSRTAKTYHKPNYSAKLADIARPNQVPARPLSKLERASIRKWLGRTKELVRTRELVRGDEQLAEAVVDYSSVATFGWTWPSQITLAGLLNETDRNVRKRLARLQKCKLLIVIPPSYGWSSNRYVPFLNDQPLLNTALNSQQVRDAIATSRRGKGDIRTPTAEEPEQSGTQVPAKEERSFRSKRNGNSTESSAENLRERISPISYPAPDQSEIAFRRRDEGRDLGFPEKDRTASLGTTAMPGEQAGEDQLRSEDRAIDDEPQGRPHSHASQQAAPVLQIAFARLMRIYKHPPGSVDHPAYRPSARKVWNGLTAQQQQAAVQAASRAPGKEWLACWAS